MFEGDTLLLEAYAPVAVGDATRCEAYGPVLLSLLLARLPGSYLTLSGDSKYVCGLLDG